MTKERVYDPNGKVRVITYACVVLFLALAVYMGYFLQMKSEDVINNPYNATTGQLFRPHCKTGSNPGIRWNGAGRDYH